MKNKLFFILIFSLLCGSCGKEQGDVLTLGSELDSSDSYLLMSGNDGNHRGFAIYDTDGNFIRSTHFRAEVSVARGIVPYDNTSVLTSVDGADAIYRVGTDGEKTLFHGSAQFSGTTYGIAIGNNGNVYAVESNRIEVFDSSGLRLASNYITTTVGACVLSAPRFMLINESGQLVVVDAGGAGDKVLTYDVSAAAPTCVSSVPVGNINPYGVLLHSDGSLYITSQNDDQVWRADPDGSNMTLVWSVDTSIINNPTGIVEHPSGDLLVASSVTDTIERITTAGERVGEVPFIRDTQTVNISGLAIVGGE